MLNMKNLQISSNIFFKAQKTSTIRSAPVNCTFILARSCCLGHGFSWDLNGKDEKKLPSGYVKHSY